MAGTYRRHFASSVGLIALATLVTQGGCPSIDGTDLTPPPGELVQSEKQRVTTPDVSDADLAELVTGNSGFAFDLYQQVRDESGNLFYSPYSISIALAMTYAGAQGNTEQQMGDALKFTLPQDRLHPAFNALDLALESRSESADGEGFTLNIVNRLWGQIDYAFLAEFLDVLAVNYGAGLNLLDFRNQPDESRIEINDWVADQTKDRIQDLIAPGMITTDTRLVLTNAIYFLAAWREPFDEASTRERPFQLLNGSEVNTPMMRQTTGFGYAAGDGYEAVELPYEGDQLSMVVIMPDAGRFEEFESSLDADRVDAITASMSFERVNLTLPKFTFEWEVELGTALSTLGMPTAFSDAADFSGMNGIGGLFIQAVLHKAFVAVDEAGTEAAAATAVIIGATAVPQEPIPVTIDRPFIFLIRDIDTGTILFLGRVVDPSAS